MLALRCILIFSIGALSTSAFTQSYTLTNSKIDWHPSFSATPETGSSLFELGGFPQTSMAIWYPNLVGDAVNPQSIYGQAGTNTFYGALGNCTWYVYGRILELRDQGLLNNVSATTVLNNIKNGRRPRHAKYWDDIIGGNWQQTSGSIKLAHQYRKPGTIVVWDNGNYGHVGFIEEVSPDRRSFRISHFNWWDCANSGEESPLCDYKRIGRLFSAWMSYDDDTTYHLGTYPKFYLIE